MCSYGNGKMCTLISCTGYLALCTVLGVFAAFARADIFPEKNIYIPSFRYQRCDPEFRNQRLTLWLDDFDIMATAYGDFDITGRFVTKHNLTSPLKVSTVLKRNIFGINFKIPCIKKFGSCTYKDVCAYGYSENECPPLLEEYDIPCRCPVARGSYNIPGIQLKGLAKSKWAPLLAGKYTATIKAYQGERMVSCYHVKFTLD